MGKTFSERLPTDFPMDLLDSGCSLQSVGVSEIAWPYEDAIKVIKFLTSRGYAILGGDVYLRSDGKLTSTCDSWYATKDMSMPWEQFVVESMRIAVSYIELYHERNGGGFLYSIVFSPGSPQKE